MHRLRNDEERQTQLAITVFQSVTRVTSHHRYCIMCSKHLLLARMQAVVIDASSMSNCMTSAFHSVM